MGFFYYRDSHKLQVVNDPVSHTASSKGDPKNNPFSRNVSQGKCQGTGTVSFSHSPMDVPDIGNIQPYGIMVGAHVIPTSHGYFSPLDFQGPRDQYPVYAIADATIVNVSHRGQAIGDNQDPNHVTDEYQLWFEHSCTFYTYYDLLTSLSPDLSAAVGKLTGFDNKAVRIPVKAGQLVGRIGHQTVDFGVWNFEKTPAYFANPKSYEEDRPYLDDMFAYFVEPLRTQMLTKAARVAAPQSGKVNYDIAGKLVGGWFKEGTGGFQGPPNIQSDAGGRYWDGHLAIAYDYIDPTSIKFSIGNYEGAATQFAIKGNAPDPATIGIESGLVKYELVPGPGNDHVQATALVQMTAEDRLKLEVFPNKTASEVSGFTDNAEIYTR